MVKHSLTAAGANFINLMKESEVARTNQELRSIDRVVKAVNRLNALGETWLTDPNDEVLSLLLDNIQIVIAHQAVFFDFAQMCNLRFPNQQITQYLSNGAAYQRLNAENMVRPEDIELVNESIRQFSKDSTPIIIEYAAYLQQQKSDFLKLCEQSFITST